MDKKEAEKEAPKDVEKDASSVEEKNPSENEEELAPQVAKNLIATPPPPANKAATENSSQRPQRKRVRTFKLEEESDAEFELPQKKTKKLEVPNKSIINSPPEKLVIAAPIADLSHQLDPDIEVFKTAETDYQAAKTDLYKPMVINIKKKLETHVFVPKYQRLERIPPFDMLITFSLPPPDSTALPDELFRYIDYEDEANEYFNRETRKRVLIQAPPRTIEVAKYKIDEIWTDIVFYEKIVIL